MMTKSKAKPQVQKLKMSSRFHRMSQRDGGVSRQNALKRAAAEVEKLKTEYPQWISDDLALLQKMVASLAQSEDRSDQFEKMYTKLRHIRDLGSTFGYPMVTAVGDSFCELIYRLKSSDLYHGEAIDTHLYSLLLVCAPELEGQKVDPKDPLLDGLRKVVDTLPQPALSNAEVSLH